MALAASRAQSAPQAKQAKVGNEVVTNAAPVSMFTIPARPEYGRDPFFPNSHYMYGVQVIKRPTTAPVILILNGLSGSLDHRLAMINGRTFAEGEEGDLQTSSGRLRIQCLQISSNSVVDVAGERRELNLRR